MDMTSFQSIEQQLHQQPTTLQSQKNQYLHNLKSQCYFKQNALKTAENLIEQYHRQNEELKIQVIRLNEKVFNLQERIVIYKHQLQNIDLMNKKNQNYEKQLLKSTSKLSQILQKYSELQEKYHNIQKQLLKYKNYKKQYQQKQQQSNNKQQKQMKQQIEKQFNHFLRTPINKNSKIGNQHNLANKSTNKKSKFKDQNQNTVKNIQLDDYSSCSQSSMLNKYNNLANDRVKYQKNKTFTSKNKSNQIRKSSQKISKIQQLLKKQQKFSKSQNQQILYNKLKIFEWKIKQKDQQIMLMLRRNKQIENKYQILKKILQHQNKEYTSSQISSVTSSNQLNIPKAKGVSCKKQRSYESEISQVQKINQKHVLDNVYKAQKVVKQNKSKKISEKQQNYPKITYFQTGCNDSTDLSTWKNLYGN